jgi:hypothetical protein
MFDECQRHLDPRDMPPRPLPAISPGVDSAPERAYCPLSQSDLVQWHEAAFRCDAAILVTIGGKGDITAASGPHWFCSSSRYPEIISATAQPPFQKSHLLSATCENRTKSVKSGGLETNGSRERISGLARHTAVRRSLRESPWLLGFFDRSRATGECWSRVNWRRERNWKLTFSRRPGTKAAK